VDPHGVTGAAATVGGAPVSVVVPCYRCAAVLPRAVASVAAQTWRPAEVVLVDDASGDGTWACIGRLAAEYPPGWIVPVRLDRNGGPATARNVGWARAAQPLVAFLDADDEWLPEKVALHARWMLERPDVALSGHERPDHRAPVTAASRDGIRGARRVGPAALLVRNRFHTSGVMLRAALVARRFPEPKRRSEDYLFWLQLAWAGLELWSLDAPLARAHKAVYGGGGLSGDLWAMERGELDTYARLAREHRAVAAALPALALYSLSKHVVRLARTAALGRPRPSRARA
jgi:glycosyltransferase involved in cell wall biosynthesis